MLFFVIVEIIVIYTAVPALAAIWSIYGLIKWRGVWRILALPPLVVALIGFVYFMLADHFEMPKTVDISSWLFEADLALIPYVFFVRLFRNDALKKRETPNAAL